MTSVYSGGLAYEYTLEPNGYGLVEIRNGQLEPNADFQRLADAFARTPNPSGNGGAKEDAVASECPEQSSLWDVANLTIPAPPSNIEQYYSDGAGTGPGLPDNDSSQWGGITSGTGSYSNSWIAMDGSEPTGVVSAVGPDGTSSGQSSDNGNDAVTIRLASTAFVLVVTLCISAFLV